MKEADSLRLRVTITQAPVLASHASAMTANATCNGEFMAEPHVGINLLAALGASDSTLVVAKSRRYEVMAASAALTLSQPPGSRLGAGRSCEVERFLSLCSALVVSVRPHQLGDDLILVSVNVKALSPMLVLKRCLLRNSVPLTSPHSSHLPISLIKDDIFSLAFVVPSMDFVLAIVYSLSDHPDAKFLSSQWDGHINIPSTALSLGKQETKKPFLFTRSKSSTSLEKSSSSIENSLIGESNDLGILPKFQRLSLVPNQSLKHGKMSISDELLYTYSKRFESFQSNQNKQKLAARIQQNGSPMSPDFITRSASFTDDSTWSIAFSNSAKEDALIACFAVHTKIFVDDIFFLEVLLVNHSLVNTRSITLRVPISQSVHPAQKPLSSNDNTTESNLYSLSPISHIAKTNQVLLEPQDFKQLSTLYERMHVSLLCVDNEVTIRQMPPQTAACVHLQFQALEAGIHDIPPIYLIDNIENRATEIKGVLQIHVATKN